MNVSSDELLALADDEGDALDPIIRRMSTRDLSTRADAARATLRALAAELAEREPAR